MLVSARGRSFVAAWDALALVLGILQPAAQAGGVCVAQWCDVGGERINSGDYLAAGGGEQQQRSGGDHLGGERITGGGADWRQSSESAWGFYMATGCCGVKKQKLNNHVLSNAAVAPAGTLCNGAAARYATMDAEEEAEEGDIMGPSAGTRSHFQTNHSILNGHHSRCHGHGGAPMANGGLARNVNGVAAVASFGKVVCNRVVNREMLVFCFDVLYSYLHGCEQPKTPKFPNEQL